MIGVLFHHAKVEIGRVADPLGPFVSILHEGHHGQWLSWIRRAIRLGRAVAEMVDRLSGANTSVLATPPAQPGRRNQIGGNSLRMRSFFVSLIVGLVSTFPELSLKFT